MTLEIIEVYDGLCFVRFDSFASVQATKDAGRRSESTAAPLSTRRGLGQYWFQDGRKLPNVFKARGDVS
jgi:hypothetical protein